MLARELVVDLHTLHGLEVVAHAVITAAQPEIAIMKLRRAAYHGTDGGMGIGPTYYPEHVSSHWMPADSDVSDFAALVSEEIMGRSLRHYLEQRYRMNNRTHPGHEGLSDWILEWAQLHPTWWERRIVHVSARLSEGGIVHDLEMETRDPFA